jgi:hypothetical protein
MGACGANLAAGYRHRTGASILQSREMDRGEPFAAFSAAYHWRPFGARPGALHDADLAADEVDAKMTHGRIYLIAMMNRRWRAFLRGCGVR